VHVAWLGMKKGPSLGLVKLEEKRKERQKKPSKGRTAGRTQQTRKDKRREKEKKGRLDVFSLIGTSCMVAGGKGKKKEKDQREHEL